MKKWYCFYTQKEAVQKLQRPVAELESEKLQQPVREFEKTKLHQAGAEMPAFFAGVPWGHHIAIITKCKSGDEALFYIKKTVEQGMSRAALINCTSLSRLQASLVCPRLIATLKIGLRPKLLTLGRLQASLVCPRLIATLKIED